MNVFKYEMKQNKKSIIKWMIGYAVFTFFFMQMSSIFMTDSSSIKELLESFGETITKTLNINMENFFSIVGFFSYIFFYISLMGAIQAMNYGLNIISKENRMKTADFLISKPKSRMKIFWEKVLASFTSILLSEIVFYIVAYLAILIASKGDFPFIPFILISFSLFFIQLLFLGIGLFLGVMIPKVKSVTTITMGATLGLFFLGFLSNIVNSNALRYISPFRYIDTNYILTYNRYEAKFIIISVLLSLVLILISNIIYYRKDIPSV